ncbi:MAG: hypothetical protein ACTSRP_06495, partial [Candidatus Helarchaeota archaeon]
MSDTDEYESLEDIVKKISSDMEKLLSNPIQICIVDKSGEIKYIDDKLKEKYEDFIKSFVSGNFDLLTVGEHSLPLSGVNIGFFKLSDLSLIILYSESGPVGQLLAFKGRMHRYADIIDKLILEPPKPKKTKVVEKTAYRVPVKLEGIKNKKFSMVEAKVIHLIDGKNTIEDICEKTKLPRLKVDEIIKKYQKKGWIKLKRVIITEEEKEPAVEKPKEKIEKVKKEVAIKKTEKAPKVEKPIKVPEKEKKPLVSEPAISGIGVPQITKPTVEELYKDIDNLLRNTDPIAASSTQISVPPSPIEAGSIQSTPAPVPPIPQEIKEPVPISEEIPQEIPQPPEIQQPIYKSPEAPTVPKPSAVPIPEEPQEVPEAIPISETQPEPIQPEYAQTSVPEPPKAVPIPEEITPQEIKEVPPSPPIPSATPSLQETSDVKVVEEGKVDEKLFDDLMSIMDETKPIETEQESSIPITPETEIKPEISTAMKADELLDESVIGEQKIQASEIKPVAVPIEDTEEPSAKIPTAIPEPVPSKTVEDSLKPLDETLSKLTDVLAKTEQQQISAEP